MNARAEVLAADIEGSAEYQALLVAAAGKPERSMGDAIIAAEPPNWADVRQMATSLLSDPVHLAIVVHLIKADTYLNGFRGMHQSLQLLYENLAESWNQLLPEADADDPEDPYYERVNYLREISDDRAFLNNVNTLQLVNVRGIGAFSARDIGIADGTVNASEEEQVRCQEGLVQAAFTQAPLDELQAVDSSINSILSLCSAIQSHFDEQAGRDHSLNMTPLGNCIQDCLDKLRKYAGSRLVESAENFVTPVTATASDTQAQNIEVVEHTSHAARDDIALPDRQSVTEAFERIIHYYRAAEPSSPVPVLAERARDLVSRSFFDLLEDLAPANKGNLTALLATLQKNPMASLLSDSYERFISGQTTAESEFQEHSAEQPDIRSRAEILEILNSIDGYFTRNEPSSPVPLVVAEIRMLIPKRFTELVNEFNRVLSSPEEKVDE